MMIDSEKEMLDFGELLRNKRLQEGMTLRKLAYELDITESYLSLLETGKREITFPLLRVILRRFPELWGQAIAYFVAYMACHDEEKRGK